MARHIFLRIILYFRDQININLQDKYGYTPLHWVCYRQNADIAKL